MTALYVAGGAVPFALVRSAVEEVAGRLRTFRPLSQKELPPSVDIVRLVHLGRLLLLALRRACCAASARCTRRHWGRARSFWTTAGSP